MGLLLLVQYAALLLLGTLAVVVFRSVLKARKYAPGPPAIPFLGNLHKLENDFRYNYILEMSKTYGDFTFFYNPLLSVLVLSSYRSMQDLLVNRGSKYSDRPGSSIVELMGTGSLITEPFGPKWKLQRKLFHQHLNKAALPQYWSIAEHEAKRCTLRLQRDPNNWSDELRLNTTRVILGITYDARDIFATDDERALASGEFLGHVIETLSPGLFWVDTFPSLKYIPSWIPLLGKEIKKLSKWGEQDRSVIPKPFYVVKGQKEAGVAKPSFALSLLEDNATDERTMAWLSASMYGGGSDTIWTALQAFLLAMVLYPEAQKKAQDEIERVVGNDRLPGMHDRDSLPYVENLIKEVLRWWLLAPGAISHRLMEDDEYKGYFIPKGTVIVPSTWCISRDEEMYPDPETFRPERFTEPNADGQLPLDPHKFAFGVGRRVCPGLDFGDMVLFSNVAIFLATSTILKGLDENGKEITPTTVPIHPVRRFPEHFRCRIEPRPLTALLDIENP